MSIDTDQKGHPQLLSPKQVGELLGISSRRVLALPLRRIRIGQRTIRFRLDDINQFLASDRAR